MMSKLYKYSQLIWKPSIAKTNCIFLNAISKSCNLFVLPKIRADLVSISDRISISINKYDIFVPRRRQVGWYWSNLSCIYIFIFIYISFQFCILTYRWLLSEKRNVYSKRPDLDSKYDRTRFIFRNVSFLWFFLILPYYTENLLDVIVPMLYRKLY